MLKYKSSRRSALVLATLALFTLSPSIASAAINVSSARPILTGLRDFSLGGGTANFNAQLENDATPGDSPTYLNSIAFSAGTNYDPNLNVSLPSSLGSYVFGTPINAGQIVYLDSVATFSSLTPNVPVGTYDFNLSFVGGSSASATDTLATYNYQIEVAETLEVSASGVSSNPNISAGESSFLSLTVNNLSTARTLYVTTIYYINNPLTNVDDISISGGTANFRYDFTNLIQSIAPSTSATGEVLQVFATPSLPVGTYFSITGVGLGFYPGDDFGIDAVINTNVIPEPLGGAASLLPLATLALRRRR